ncbi:PIR protein [Plasmodium yoelii]|uniref:PIR protein n=2 Tax=Plasmodium yoelii TaxID=5861 RepID=A0AAE9WTU0_PLAYO|nr:PIR protein [Plasmodium yoelii]WBY56479.1 PIR protein [Plasmodium yoelii yoelii]CDU17348.1 YIR protein [Plasmodium yoelii]VTZ76632.1 PIR protein [Plasmodium yoelii]|eukprot:XP_022811860.1 PIR protein [Plasmodium yoelii]
MDHRMCGRFDHLKIFLPDELNTSTDRDFHANGDIRNYCPNGSSETKECNTNPDKIKAGFIWLFEQNIVNRISNLSKEQTDIFIIYIIIWFNYMLTLKPDNNTSDLNDFYTKYTEDNTHYYYCKKKDVNCNSILKDNLKYNNFKEIIDKRKDLLNINFDDMSKFYDAFKLLCKMYTEFDEHDPKCTEYLKIANQFVEKYKELNGYSDITEGSLYYQVWSTLSNDYDNFKKKCNDSKSYNFPSLPPIKKTQTPLDSSEDNHVQDSEVASSSSSIANKLFIVLSIFGAIAILLGISYKYSLFEFRKRFQKQKLREKIKK